MKKTSRQFDCGNIRCYVSRVSFDDDVKPFWWCELRDLETDSTRGISLDVSDDMGIELICGTVLETVNSYLARENGYGRL